MKIEIKIDENYTVPKILVLTDRITDEIDELIKRISEQPASVLVGFKEDEVSMLDLSKIIRIYSANQKIFAVSDQGEFFIRLRLYELEERLNPAEFVRISNSEIINLKKVKGFDLSISGTICVKFQDGQISYVSRRYVSKIK